MALPYIGIARPILTTNDKPGDYKNGPFSSINEALTAIPVAIRFKGLTVIIIENNVAVEYWFKNGTTDADLIQKTNDSGGTDINYQKCTSAEYASMESQGTLQDDILYIIVN